MLNLSKIKGDITTFIYYLVVLNSIVLNGLGMAVDKECIYKAQFDLCQRYSSYIMLR